MISTNLLILISVVIVAIAIIVFRKNLKKLWFKIPFFEASFETHKNSISNGSGGRGGDAKVSGNDSTAIGGKGGGGGPNGKGGDGGNVEANGDNVFAMGGEGGESGQLDRGGRGGRGPLEVLINDHPEKWKEISKNFDLSEEEAKKYGKGGDGEGLQNQ